MWTPRPADLWIIVALTAVACSDPSAAGPDAGTFEPDATSADASSDDDARAGDDASPSTDAVPQGDATADAAPRADALPSPDAGPPAPVLINEILGDPPGTDGNNEFVELRCTPGLSLAPYTFMVVDGDFVMGDPAARGTVTFAKSLSPLTCGTSGLVVLQLRSVYEGVSGTTYADDFFDANLQNGTQTYLVITGGPYTDPDIDDDDDGTADDPSFIANIADSVAFSDGFADDLTYSPAVLVAASGPDAASRFASSASASTPASWYFGAVTGPAPTHYDPTELSPNFPAGGTLSPGEQNAP